MKDGTTPGKRANDGFGPCIGILTGDTLTMNRLLFDAAAVSSEGLVTLNGQQARHLREVLRVTPGQSLRIGLSDGPAGIGTVVAVSDHGVRLACSFDPAPPDRSPIDLLLALPRPKVMRRLWPQLAAIGLDHIILVNAAKVERMYFDAHVLRSDIVRPLLIEGLQQAGDTRLPRVGVVRRLKPWLEDDLEWAVPRGIRLLADPSAGSAVADAMAPASVPPQRVLAAVGPEGGWTDYETGMLRDHGFRPVTMGSRTLRSDTACIALLALIHDRLRRPFGSQIP